MAYAIRPARNEDCAALVDFWIATWNASMPGIDFEPNRAVIRRELDLALGDGRHVLVATDLDQAPCGFLILNPATCDIEQIAVAPAHLGKGAAATLMAGARALSPHQLQLTVNKGNPRAIWFYAREGFAVIGEETDPLSGLPVMRMRWRSTE